MLKKIYFTVVIFLWSCSNSKLEQSSIQRQGNSSSSKPKSEGIENVKKSADSNESYNGSEIYQQRTAGRGIFPTYTIPKNWTKPSENGVKPPNNGVKPPNNGVKPPNNGGVVIQQPESPTNTNPQVLSNAFLKSYAQNDLICTHVGSDGEAGILTGNKKDQNRSFVTSNFNCIQPAVYAAWGGFWPSSKPADIGNITFQTQALNEIVNWGVAENLKIVPHMLIGKNFYFPEWFYNTNYSSADLDKLLEKYVRAIVDSNGNSAKFTVWNVINEVLAKDGGYCVDGTTSEDCKWAKMGMESDKSGLTGSDKIVSEHPVFIRKTLEYAAKYTNAKLEIRDYEIEFTKSSSTNAQGKYEQIQNKKTATLYQLIKHLKNSGTKIDAVGFQTHFNAGKDNYHVAYDFLDFENNLKRFKNLGVDVYLTEIDVGLRWDETEFKNGVQMPKADVNWNAFRAEQPLTYGKIVEAARKGGATMIGVWGFRDGSMGTWREGQQAWILNQDYSKKPAYDEIVKALFNTWK
jgi:GH35 family endo-1,4-beta-xylanase